MTSNNLREPPPRPSKAQLKHQAKSLDSFLPSSKLISVNRFVNQSNDFSKRFKSDENQKLVIRSTSAQQDCQLDDLINPLESIYKDSNLLSELKEHQHELATPYGSLHAIHLNDSSVNDETQQASASLSSSRRNIRPGEEDRSTSSDIPVFNPRPSFSTPAPPKHVDPSLLDANIKSFIPAPGPNSETASNQNLKPKRIRKKASGPRQALDNKPKPIQDLINKLTSTGLKTLASSYDGMFYVKAIGKSDWNTSTQPIFSNLTTSNFQVSDEDPPPVILTVTFHPVSKSQDNETKAIAPRKQTINILSNQTLSDLKDSIICTADRIPKSLNDYKWSQERWISGSVIEIENVLFGDHRELNGSDKSDYSMLLHKLAPKIIKREIEPIYSNPETKIESEDQLGKKTTEKSIASSSESVPQKEKEIQLQVSKFGMESVRFDQLRIKAGEPYWLLHQGNCEHLFTIDEIRAVHSTDPKPTEKPNLYPITTFLSRLNSLKCRVCDRDPASLITIDDELVSESPCFLCWTCFKLLHGHDLRRELAMRKNNSSSPDKSKSKTRSKKPAQNEPDTNDSASNKDNNNQNDLIIVSADVSDADEGSDGNEDRDEGINDNDETEIKVEWGRVYHRTWWAVPLISSA